MISTVQDISLWYTPERIEAEEKLWAKGPYKENARRVLEVCQRYRLHTIAEIGCGTGWVPTALDPSLEYVAGVDNNAQMLLRAADKNPGKRFLLCDIRELNVLDLTVDLVCSFAVLKHFSLTEWPDILSRILSAGRYGLFTQHVLLDDRTAMDVGTEFHHIWPTEPEIMRAVAAAGHEIIESDYTVMDLGMNAPEGYFVTGRRA